MIKPQRTALQTLRVGIHKGFIRYDTKLTRSDSKIENVKTVINLLHTGLFDTSGSLGYQLIALWLIVAAPQFGQRVAWEFIRITLDFVATHCGDKTQLAVT